MDGDTASRTAGQALESKANVPVLEKFRQTKLHVPAPEFLIPHVTGFLTFLHSDE